MREGLRRAIEEISRVEEWQRQERLKEERFESLVDLIADRFPTFGGGRPVYDDNPIAHAAKDGPLVFAAGADVRKVVKLVLEHSRHE